MKEYVLCPNCQYPELKIALGGSKKNKLLISTCNACGNVCEKHDTTSSAGKAYVNELANDQEQNAKKGKGKGKGKKQNSEEHKQEEQVEKEKVLGETLEEQKFEEGTNVEEAKSEDLWKCS